MSILFKRIYREMLSEEGEAVQPPASSAANAPSDGMSMSQYIQDVHDDPKLAAFTPVKKTDVENDGVTTLVLKHRHDFNVDDDGNGTTSDENGHVHKIKNFKIQKINNHVHLLVLNK